MRRMICQKPLEVDIKWGLECLKTPYFEIVAIVPEEVEADVSICR